MATANAKEQGPPEKAGPTQPDEEQGSKEGSVPKIAHYVWWQGVSKLPEEYAKNLEESRKALPDWQFMGWDEESVRALAEEMGYSGSLDRLQLLHQKVDMTRYLVLLKHGGLTLDADSIAQQDALWIEKRWPGYELWVSKLRMNSLESCVASGNLVTVNNAIMLAVPGSNPLWKCLDYMGALDTSPTRNDAANVMRTYGPYPFTHVVRCKCKKGEAKIMPAEVFEPAILSIARVRKTGMTTVFHQQHRSWAPFMGCYRKLVISLLQHFWLSIAFLAGLVLIAMIIILAVDRSLLRQDTG